MEGWPSGKAPVLKTGEPERVHGFESRTFLCCLGKVNPLRKVGRVERLRSRKSVGSKGCMGSNPIPSSVTSCVRVSIQKRAYFGRLAEWKGTGLLSRRARKGAWVRIPYLPDWRGDRVAKEPVWNTGGHKCLAGSNPVLSAMLLIYGRLAEWKGTGLLSRRVRKGARVRIPYLPL